MSFESFSSKANTYKQKSDISIPASSLVQALNLLAGQTKSSLIYPYKLASSIQVKPINGNYTLEEALNLLLVNTQLKGEVTRNGVIHILKPQKQLKEAIHSQHKRSEDIVIEKQTDDQDFEVISIEGRVLSKFGSINFKHYTDSQEERLANKEIRKSANESAADIVRNVPSVGVNTSYGEGTKVSVRGFGPEFNNVLFNGRVIATENQGRAFSFDVLPGDIIDTVNVYKTSSSDMVTGSIGATINLKSAKPSQFNGFYSRSSLGSGYNTLSNKYSPDISQLFSFYDGNFGALLSIHFSERSYRVESINVDGWFEADLSYLNETGSNYSNVYVPRNFDLRIDEGTQTRIGGNMAFEYNFSPDTYLVAELLFSKFEVDSNIKSSGNWTHVNPIGTSQNLNQSFESVTIDNNNTLTSYRYDASLNFSTDFVELNRNRPTETTLVGINFGHNFSDSIESNFDLSFSSAENNNGGNQQFIIAGVPFANPAYQLITGQDYGSIAFQRPFGIKDIRSHGTIYNGEDISDNIFQVKADFDWFFENSIIEKLDFGFYHSIRDKRRAGYRTPNGLEFSGYAFDIPDDLFTPLNTSSFLNGTQPNTWYSFDAQQYVDFLWSDEHIESQIIGTDHWLADTILIRKESGGIQPVYYPSNSWSVEELLTELYASIKFGDDSQLFNYSGNLGVRYAFTDITSEGTKQNIRTIDTVDGDPTNLFLTYGDEIDISASNSYDNLLPYFDLKLDFSDKSIWRFSLSKTMTRATLSDYAITLGNYIPRVGASIATQGNPYLKPIKSTNFDLSYNYYWNEYSLFEIAYFHKDFRQSIANQANNKSLHDSLNGEFTVISPINIGDNNLKGLELNVVTKFNYLPYPFNGLGLSARYIDVDTSTRIHQLSQSNIPAIEGASDSYNLKLFYDLNELSWSLNYLYKDDFLETSAAKLGDAVWVLGRGQFDANLSYRFENTTIKIQANNITNEGYKTYSVYEERLINYISNGTDYRIILDYIF